MDQTNVVWTVAIVAITISLLLGFWVQRLLHELARERSSKHRLSTRYGLLTEQFMPFIESYPWNPTNFRFLGSPIDGVQFEEDRVILVEFKAANSRMTLRQRQIRDLVAAHKVEFELIAIN